MKLIDATEGEKEELYNYLSKNYHVYPDGKSFVTIRKRLDIK